MNWVTLVEVLLAYESHQIQSMLLKYHQVLLILDYDVATAYQLSPITWIFTASIHINAFLSPILWLTYNSTANKKRLNSPLSPKSVTRKKLHLKGPCKKEKNVGLLLACCLQLLFWSWLFINKLLLLAPCFCYWKESFQLPTVLVFSLGRWYGLQEFH